MKKMLLTLLLASTVSRLSAGDAGWSTDLPKALAQAKAEKKRVLLDFTGSDWCGWCTKFNKEALSKPAFTEYAAKNLVLVELDFPQRKKLDPQLKQANEALKTKYKVRGFPTFVVLDEQGQEVGRQTGYAEGGAEAFIAKLDGFKKH